MNVVSRIAIAFQREKCRAWILTVPVRASIDALEAVDARSLRRRSSLTGSPLARTPDTIERTWRTRTPSAISTSIWSSSTTLVTLPTSPPEVTTVSPRRKFLTSS